MAQDGVREREMEREGARESERASDGARGREGGGGEIERVRQSFLDAVFGTLDAR